MQGEHDGGSSLHGNKTAKWQAGLHLWQISILEPGVAKTFPSILEYPPTPKGLQSLQASTTNSHPGIKLGAWGHFRLKFWQGNRQESPHSR